MGNIFEEPIASAPGAPGPQGPIGPTGPQGIQGTPGSDGAQGPMGLPGAAGDDWRNGVGAPVLLAGDNEGDNYLDQGSGDTYSVVGGAWVVQGNIRGPQGIQGVDGPQGPIGPQGIQGVPGAQGVAGNDGLDGADGADGAPGAQGIQGIPGNDGADGAQGIQGIQGDAGADGNDGAVGATGATGAQGIQGLPGIQGDVGAQGIQGLPGNDGADGAQGIQGLTGPAGADGATGIQGIQGPAGADGAVGAQGPAGPTGPIDILTDVDTTTNPPEVPSPTRLRGSIMEWDGVNWVPADLPVYGTQYQRGNVDVVNTNGSNIFFPKVDLVKNAGPGGQFELEWGYGWNHNAQTDDIEVRLIQNLGGVITEIGERHLQEPKDAAGVFGATGSNQKHYVMRRAFIALTDGQTPSWSIEYRSTVNGVTSSMWNAWISIKRTE